MRKAAMMAAVLVAASVAGGASAQSRAPGQPDAFRIFFDWGKPVITRDAASVLDDAATAFLQEPRGKLRLTGHADRSGPANSNRLSALKRAEAVRDYLAARGVPRKAMTLLSFGEERPLVATEDGVREVQNRRVEISFGDGGSQR